MALPRGARMDASVCRLLSTWLSSTFFFLGTCVQLFFSPFYARPIHRPFSLLRGTDRKPCLLFWPRCIDCSHGVFAGIVYLTQNSKCASNQYAHFIAHVSFIRLHRCIQTYATWRTPRPQCLLWHAYSLLVTATPPRPTLSRQHSPLQSTLAQLCTYPSYPGSHARRRTRGETRCGTLHALR